VLDRTAAIDAQDALAESFIHVEVDRLIARLLVDLFHARFDPARERGSADAEAAELSGRITAEIDDVGSLDEDRILRSFLGVILATTRTTYFQSGRGWGTEWRLRSSWIRSRA
jgi:NAD-specific glutamate dehydrogenase